MQAQVLGRAKLRLYNVDERLQLAGMRGGHEVNIILRGTVSLSGLPAADSLKVHPSTSGYPVRLTQRVLTLSRHTNK